MRRKTVWLLLATAAILVAAACSKVPDDQALATQIKARMFSDSQVKSANLNVVVNKGEVTLEGEVPSDSARYAAFKIASETPGVHQVNDRMTVKLAQALPPPELPAPEPPPAPIYKAPKPVTKKAASQVETPALPPTTTPPSMSAPPPPPEPQPKKYVVPAGTRVLVRMIDSIDSKVNQTGQMFHASLESPILVDDETVVPQGTDVYVRLAEAKSAGKFAGRSELRVELAQMVLQGRTYPLVSGAYDRAGSSRGKNTAAKVGGGAALGAIIGAIAGGGRGAAIGSVAGAGAGGAAQVFTHGEQIRIPSETTLDFRLEAPVAVTLLPENQTERRRSR